MDLGKKIHDLRIKKGLTLEQVGVFVGVSRPTVLKWESGQIKNMRRDKIVKLAQILGTSPGELLGWEIEHLNPTVPLDNLPAQSHIFPLTSDEKRLIACYRANPSMQPAVHRLLGILDETNEHHMNGFSDNVMMADASALEIYD